MKDQKMNLKQALKHFGGKRKDAPSLPIDCLQFEEGFNARYKYPEEEIYALMCKIFLPIENGGKLEQTKTAEGNLIQAIGGHWDTDLNKFIVTDGHRRTLAIHMGVEKYGFEAGLIPLKVLPKNELERATIVLTSNSQKSLEPLEIAKHLQKVQDLHIAKYGKKMTLKELAEQAGMSHVSIKNYMDLLRLPNVTIEAIENDEINYTDALATVKAIKKEKVEGGISKKMAEKVAFNMATVEEINNRKEQKQETVEAPKMEVVKTDAEKEVTKAIERIKKDLPTLITIRLKGIIEGIQEAKEDLNETQQMFANSLLGVLKGIKRGDDLEDVIEHIKKIG